jgi:hypothetical protein
MMFTCLLLSGLLSQDVPAVQTVPPPAQYNPTSVNFGLGAVVPGNVPYQPLTSKERTALWFNSNVLNPRVYLRSVLLTIPEHTSNSPAAWGQGWDAYGQRVGSRFARFAISSSVEHAGSAALGHDPRYISCRNCTSRWGRLKHSFIYNFMTYNRNGKPVVHVSHLAGQFGSEMIAASWIPGRTWRSELAPGLIEQVSLGWLSNIAREFSPEIKRLISRKNRSKPVAGAAGTTTVR